jgi:SAM-dependent methyltransferase
VLRNAASFQISGYCYACRKKTDFNVKNEGFVNGKQVAAPNWRETLSCSCKLINRLRASLHLFDTQCTPTQRDRIYLTEQTTPIFNWLTDRFPNVTGSEYLGDTVPFGTKSPNGIRNESLTRLSFADGSFDHILSFDVFEHIPDYGRAFAECFRVLAPCGNLLFSVPFIPSNEETLVRARVTLDGGIEHLLPAEYHGDPMSADGCLCFYHFGWDMLANLKLAGFDDATALLYWSDHFGYLGGEQILFLARKG